MELVTKSIYIHICTHLLIHTHIYIILLCSVLDNVTEGEVKSWCRWHALPVECLCHIVPKLTPDGHPNILRNIIKIKRNRSINNKYKQIYIYKKIINKIIITTSKFHILLYIGIQLRGSVMQASQTVSGLIQMTLHIDIGSQ